MRLTILLLFLIPYVAGNNHKADITSDRCKMNLKGEVKEMVERSAANEEEFLLGSYFIDRKYQFTENGYLTQVDAQLGISASIDSISYFNDAHKEAGYFSFYRMYGDIPHSAFDSVVTTVINDTYFIQHTYRLRWYMSGLNGPSYKRYDFQSEDKYVYNTKHQLIGKTIQAIDGWDSTSTYYYYNAKGYLNKKIEVDLRDKDTTVTNITIKKVDKKGNPTRTIEYVSGSYEDTVIYIYEYTYY